MTRTGKPPRMAFQILDLKRKGFHVLQIAEHLRIPEGAVYRALRWAAEHALDLSVEQDVRLAIVLTEQELKHLNERLETWRDGWEETSRKEYSNGSFEVTTTCRKSPSSEVALLRLIHHAQDRLFKLKRVHEDLMAQFAHEDRQSTAASGETADESAESLAERIARQRAAMEAGR